MIGIAAICIPLCMRAIVEPRHPYARTVVEDTWVEERDSKD